MKRDYTPLEVDDKGWSAWQSPIQGSGKRNYRLACCDCKLVHEMQFRVKKGRGETISVEFRASRNNRATAALRRSKKRNGKPFD